MTLRAWIDRSNGMSVRERLAVSLLAVAFAVAPAVALAAELCGACCCPPAPCHAASDGSIGSGGCDAQLASAASCSSGASEAPPLAAKRTLESSSVHVALALPSATPLDGCRPPTPAHAADLARRVSPLRLSVVLRS